MKVKIWNFLFQIFGIPTGVVLEHLLLWTKLSQEGAMGQKCQTTLIQLGHLGQKFKWEEPQWLNTRMEC